MAINWNAYIATHPHADTGPKKFEIGDVWSCAVPEGIPYIYEIQGLDANGRASVKILAGNIRLPAVHSASNAALHSVLLSRTSDLHAFSVPTFDWTAPVKFEMVPFEETPSWAVVIIRIMKKAEAHFKAGRAGNFQQVLVPKKDYEALQEHFRSTDVQVHTCLGLISVYPVNPDGATFVD